MNGSGRTGRLIANLELMKQGYLPIDVKFTDRSRYYDAFDEYYGKQNAKAMTELFAKYERERLRNHISALQPYDEKEAPIV